MWLIEAVTALRAYKSENGLKSRDPLFVTLEERVPFALSRSAVASLAHVTWVEIPADDARSIGLELGRLLVSRPDATIDVASECARVDAKLAEVTTELARAERQLSNGNFIDRAPAHLVQAERDKAARFVTEIAELEAERSRLGCR